MKLNPGLAAAVAVFRELGWDGAHPTEALTLPLGTPEQRRTALAGLRGGEWGEIGELGEGRWGWISAVDVDAALLGSFAVRLGVDARRAASVLPNPSGWRAALAAASLTPDELCAELLAERGPVFAAGFIEAACRPSRRVWEHSTSVHAGAAVRLVARHGLHVPPSVDYLKDWAAFALAVLAGDTMAVSPRDRGLPEEDLIRSRFVDHVDAAVAVGMPVTGPFGRVFPAGVAAGLLGRGHAIRLAIAALDAAQRPGDRAAWVKILTDDLAITDAELVASADALVAALASGVPTVVERLAPPLLAHLDGAQLADVAVVSLMVGTRQAQRTVLAALASRACPEDAVRLALAPRLAELAVDRDRGVARAATALVASWGIEAEPEAEPAAVQRLWRDTPPVWQVPAFDHGPETPEALTDAAATLLPGPEAAVDVTVERFLAVANAVALRDPDLARRALRGVGERWTSGLRPVGAWVKGETPRWGLDDAGSDTRAARTYELTHAREFAVFQRLGEVPCLLSEPSTVDLRVNLGDLVGRLRAYVAADAVASEADLFLALTRLDVSRPEPVDADALAVPVVLQSGETMLRHAGRVLRDYLADPLDDPGLLLSSDRWRHWRSAPIEHPASLGDFPDRLKAPTAASMPAWGDASLTSLCWSTEANRDGGVIARQVVRRSTPLPPGGAINLLAIQRSAHPVAAADVSLAVVEAWERGLLRPGVADARYLDWMQAPTNIAALARALVEVAADGVLSVVWPVLDDLVTASLQAPRMLAGTAEVADAIETLLPEVHAGIASGLAPASALDLPGVRALAARSGSALAVVTARRIVALLPAPAAVAEPPVAPEIPFDEVWPAGAGTQPALPDGVRVDVDWLDAAAPPLLLRFDLTLPDAPAITYRVAKDDWVYDLGAEGQCEASPVPAAGERAGEKVWLRWDAAGNRLVAESTRNWPTAASGPLRGEPSPLSDALITVVLGLQTQDGYAALTGRHLLSDLCADGRLGAASVRNAVRVLLAFDAFNPAKAVRLLESDARHLPILWPLLTEPIRAAGAVEGTPPRWLNRVLDVALARASVLREASRRGLIPPDAAAWPGLAELAARRGSSAALTKARELRRRLG